MDYLSKSDQKMMTILGKISDTAILNCLFMITCLPIVTFGAGVAALNDNCERMNKGASFIVREYVADLKENFILKIKIGLTLLLVFAAILFNFTVIANLANPIFQVLMTSLLGVISCLFLLVANLIFLIPIDQEVKGIDRITTIVTIGLKNPKWTCLLILWNVLNLSLFIASLLGFKIISFYYVSVGFALMGRVNAKCFNKIKIPSK